MFRLFNLAIKGVSPSKDVDSIYPEVRVKSIPSRTTAELPLSASDSLAKPILATRRKIPITHEMA